MKIRNVYKCAACKEEFVKALNEGTTIMACPLCSTYFHQYRLRTIVGIQVWQSTSVWYKPWTWGSGQWVRKEGKVLI